MRIFSTLIRTLDLPPPCYCSYIFLVIIFLQTADAADMTATMSLEAAEEEKVVVTVTTVTTIAAGDVSAHFYRSSMPCVLARRLELLFPLSPFLFSLILKCLSPLVSQVVEATAMTTVVVEEATGVAMMIAVEGTR